MNGLSLETRWVLALTGMAAGIAAAAGKGEAVSSAVRPESPAESTNETSILYIGNSFIFVNDLPGMLAMLAEAGGQKPVVHRLETPGGCSFKKHWEDGKALKAIQSRRWDYVVLQEVSRGSVTARDSMFEYGAKLNAAITNQGAKTLLFMTWAWPTPDEQPAITKAYRELGEQLKAQVAPVGIAWDRALRDYPAIQLFAKDRHHASPAGTYLAACVFYATLYGRSPEGLPSKVKDLEEADAASLQKLAAIVAGGGSGTSSKF